MASSSHQAREARSSRASRRSKALSEREEHLLHAGLGETGTVAQLVQRALAHGLAVGEQHEAVAGARGVVELVDREEERAALRRLGAQKPDHLAGLAQVEPVERLVEEQQRLRRKQAERDQEALALPLGEGAHR